MYTPTRISSFNIDSQEKELSSGKIESNLGLIGQETKLLDGKIRQNKVISESNKKDIEDQGISFKKYFLFL